ncbi:MAG: hypothetical protein ACQSGP_13265 [Frankia sp.]
MFIAGATGGRAVRCANGSRGLAPRVSAADGGTRHPAATASWDAASWDVADAGRVDAGRGNAG